MEAQIRAWSAKAEKLATDVARGLGIDAFRHVLEISPQYSGDFAANWKYSLNFVDTTFDVGVVTPSNKYKGHAQNFRAEYAFSQGDWPARNYALAANAGRASAFQLGDTAYISNSSEHDEPYAWLIEKNKIRFRPENSAYGGETVQQTVEYLRGRYSDITLSQARRLASMGL